MAHATLIQPYNAQIRRSISCIDRDVLICIRLRSASAGDRCGHRCSRSRVAYRGTAGNPESQKGAEIAQHEKLYWTCTVVDRLGWSDQRRGRNDSSRDRRRRRRWGVDLTGRRIVGHPCAPKQKIEREMDMAKYAGLALLLVGTAGMAVAGAPLSAPEIDPAMGIGALALLSGGLLVIRARRKK